jgi:hypothetical protein
MLPNPHTGNMSSSATYRNDPKPRQQSNVTNSKPYSGTTKGSSGQSSGSMASSIADALYKQYGRKS